jgi:hypothetical protein
LGIITEGGGLAVFFRGETHSFVCFAGMVELKNAQKSLSHLQWMMCLGITDGMRSTSTSPLDVMLMLSPLHLFIKQKSRQAANRLLGNGCYFVSVNFPTREDKSTECVIWLHRMNSFSLCWRIL